MGDGLGYAPLLTPGGLVGAYSPERNPVKRQKVQHFAPQLAPAFSPPPLLPQDPWAPPVPPQDAWAPHPQFRNYDDIYNGTIRAKRQRIARPVSPAYDPGSVVSPVAGLVVKRPVSPTYDPGPIVGSVVGPIVERPVSPTYDPGPIADPIADSIADSVVSLVVDPIVKQPVSPEISTGSVVESVTFRVRSAEEIKRLSAVEVKTSCISDENGRAVPHGLRDPRFGPCFGTNTPCGLCGATPQKPCSGHVGHFCFEEPLYAVNLIKFVITWLRQVCPSCGHVHVDPSRAQKCILKNITPRERKCAECDETLIKSVVWRRDLQTLVVKRAGEEEPLPAKEAYEIFDRAPETHPVFSVITHPKHLLSRVISVPGLCLRPCIGDGGGEGARGESDLTYRLKQLVVANELYGTKKKQGSDPVSLRSALFGLQDLYTQYLDVSKSVRGGGGQEQRQPKYKSNSCLLKGKQGLLRASCTGKRVDHASRCPIAPLEGSGDVGHPSQVGVPDWLCKKHVVPIRCTDHNRKALQDMIAAGKCNFVEREGERIDLSTTSDVGRLRAGKDVVYRQLTTGDVVLFNRQPSLSMRSMQGLLVVRLPPVEKGVGSRVFRLPLAQTTPFNADFDGDEMNLHVPQTPEARAEALVLMGAQRNVLSANSGGACIVPVQTARLASYLLTRNTTKFTKREWFSCLGHAPDRVLERVHREGSPDFPAPGRLFWSLCLPADYSWSSRGVTIVKGNLQKGRVNKSVLSALVHDISLDVSPAAALDFIHSLTCLSRGYSTMKEPGTIHFADMSPKQSLVDACKRLTLKERRKAAKPGADVAACRERAMRGMMSLVYRDDARKKMKENGLDNLIESGAKGSRANKAVMLGFLGPMLSLEDTKHGVFQPPEANPRGENRCFVTKAGAEPFDDGFIETGYSSGMNLTQYTMHAIAGRRGLTSSSRKVGKIGYMYRRCSASNDSLVVKHGQVVDTSVHPPQVVSFLYGGDGRSCYVSEKERVDVPDATPKTNWAHAALLSDVAALTKLFPDARDRQFDVPVSIRRILFQAKHRTYSTQELRRGESSQQLWKQTTAVAETHGGFYGDYVKLWVRIHLHPHRMSGIPPCAWKWALEEVDKRLWKARAPDGECVGCHAASSLSAAATQTTLNSFHNLGSKEVGSYRGLEETVNLVKNRSVKATRFRLRLDPGLTREEKCAETEVWANKYRLVTLRDVVLKREPPACQAEDQRILQAYWAFPDESVRFQPKMRLEVQCGVDLVFDVRRALLECGVRHASYALRENDNTWIFHLSSVLSSRHLATRVTGRIPGCRAEGDVVVCDAANMEELIDRIVPQSFWTNCFHKTRAKYGIEAARRLILIEMQTMLASFGCKMAVRHIELFADRCCQMGALMGATRHGIRSRNGDRVLHATFEMPVNVLSEGAVAAKTDRLNGSQERQIVGATNRTGSHHPWVEMVPDHSLQPIATASDSESDSDLGVEDDTWLREWMEKRNNP